METVMRKMNVSKARKSFSALVNDVSVTNNPVRIVRSSRSGRSAILVSEEYEPIIDRNTDFSTKIAFMFTDRFFNEAPQHIKNSQRKELETLADDKLCLLLQITSFPLAQSLRKKLVEAIGHDVIERLEKRKFIADSILKAEEEGLYEREEHFTGLLEFE